MDPADLTPGVAVSKKTPLVGGQIIPSFNLSEPPHHAHLNEELIRFLLGRERGKLPLQRSPFHEPPKIYAAEAVM
jgi:hypothetical protein